MHVLYVEDFPRECVADCSAQGAVDEAVAYWLAQEPVAALISAIPAETLRRCLKGYGAWEREELDDDAQNRARVLWLACGTFRDGDDMFCVE